MKKRIVAVLLSFSIFCCSLSCGKRAYAEPGTIIGGVVLFTLAMNLLGLMTGNLDGAAGVIGDVLEGGVDAITNPESAFQENWTTGANQLPPSTALFAFEQIRNTVEGWFNNGELQVVDGRVKLTYDQYIALYGKIFTVLAKPDIDFDAGFNFTFLDADLVSPFALSSVPIISEYFFTFTGQSYSPVYFNDDRIVFSDHFLFFNSINNNNQGQCFIRQVTQNYGFTNLQGGFQYSGSYTDAYSNYQPVLLFSGLSSISLSFNFWGTDTLDQHNFDECYVYEDGLLVRKPISEVDVSGMHSGLLITTGAYGDFLKSVNGYTSSLVPPENLDDLSDVLPTEYNPTLSFPADPDLTRPLENQITVGDVPGVADLPLSDYLSEVKTEIDVPSIICTKFPFCIPYDFMRFLGLLCADPVAPVFRIPISTNPDNLQQWTGNQTVGEYLNTDEPLFEIDEEIVIDLSVIPLLQPICYTCFIVGFIFLLLHITPKMIQH